MSDKVKEIASTDEFKSITGTGTVLVDFYATWCGPCRLQQPILENVAARIEGKAVIIKVDTDEHPEIAAQYQIEKIPTLIVFKDGQVAERFLGIQQEDILVEAIS